MSADQNKEWQPIKTAPRDGTVIEVMADGIAASVMFWDAAEHCWIEADGPCIWSEGDDCGPTHWRPTVSPMVQRVMKRFESALARRRAYGPPSIH